MKGVKASLRAVSLILALAPFANLTVTVEVRHTLEHPTRSLWWIERVEEGNKFPFRFAQVPDGTNFDGGRRPQRQRNYTDIARLGFQRHIGMKRNVRDGWNSCWRSIL